MGVKQIVSWLLMGMLWCTQGLAQLTADFSVNVGEGCLPLAVSFQDLSTGNPDRWFWDIGDGRISTNQNPSFLFLEAGNYTIKLTVYRGNNDSATITKPAFIKVYEFPQVNFTADNLVGCAPLTVRFSDSSSSGSGSVASRIWDFGDGFTGTNQNAQHTYRTPGNYNVTLTVENNFGCTRSLSFSNFITINDSIRSKFDFQFLPACEAPFAVAFQNVSIGNVISSQWDFGDGATSTELAPVHLFLTEGIFSVRLITGSAAGCTDTIIQQINVTNNVFKAQFTNDASVCRRQNAGILNTTQPANAIDSVRWNFGDGTSSTDLNPSKVYNNPGNYTIRLIAFSGICRDTTTSTIRVLSGPNISFTADSLGSCTTPLNVNFTNTSTGGTVLRWNLGNGERPTTANPSTTYTESGSYDVTLVVRSPNGCIDSLIRPNYIRIRPPIITNFPPNSFIGCFPWTNTFRPRVNTFSPVTRWEWDFGDGRTSTDSFPTITFSDQGSYEVRLTVFTEDGCSTTAVTQVVGGTRPVFSFVATPTLVCPLDTVRFVGTFNTPFDDWLWDFGDGATSKDTSPIHRYLDTGYMTIKLYVTNSGCQDSLVIEEYLYVNPPISRFDVDLDCENQFRRQFTDNSIAPTSWFWDFGNGDTSTEQNPLYTYADTGTYVVTLRVRNDSCEHESSQTIIVLNERPDFLVNQSGTCSETMAEFVAAGPQLQTNNILSYRWQFGAGSIEETTTNDTITKNFSRNRNLAVQLTVTDLNGCQFAIEKPIRILLTGPEAILAPVYQYTCLGNNLSFADSSIVQPQNPIVKWTWDFGDGTIQEFSAPSFSHIYNDTGYFNVQLKVEDANGCVDSVRVDSAVQIFKPFVDFISPDSVVCINTEVSFENRSVGYGLSYKWYLGQNDSSSLATPVKFFNANSNFAITLIATDSAGCTASLEKLAYINVGGQKAMIAASDTFSSCPPLRVSFTNQSIGALRSFWNFDNGNTSILRDPVQTFTRAGTFQVRLIIEGNGGCRDTAFQEIVIRGPQGVFTYGPLTGCPPLTVNFSSSTQNVQTYIWDFSDGETRISNTASATHTYLNPGNYRPRVILEDGQKCRIPVIGSQMIRVVGVRSLIKPLSNYQFCDTAVIAFSDSSITSTTIRSWLWDFGDGETSTLQNPVHVYRNPGRYTVSLIVETIDNCSSSSVLPNQVVVAPTPQIDIGGDVELCLPASYQFNANWLNADTTTLQILWNLGGGNTSNQLSPPRVTYPGVGIYSAGLRVTNNYGCTDTLQKTLTVTEVADVLFADITDRLFCDSGLVRFREAVVARAEINRWNWDFGDGNTSNQRNPNHLYNEPGIYTVSLEVGAVNDCISKGTLPGQIRVVVTQKIAPLADTSFCIPGTVNFRASLRSGFNEPVTWNWNLGNGNQVAQRNPGNIVFPTPGVYTANVVATDNNGCADTLYKTITANDTPRLQVTPNSPLCVGSTIQLVASGADNYVWNPSPSLSCLNCSQPVASPDSTVVYRVIGSTVAGCSRTDSVQIRVVFPQPLLAGPGDTLCLGESFRMFTRGTQTYSWSPATGLSATNIANPIATPTVTTQYRVIGSDSVNCFPDTGFVTIAVFPRPVVDIIEDRITNPIGTVVTLNTNSSNVTRWRWTPAVGLSCIDCATPQLTVTRAITYRVEADNPGGCPATDEVVVEPLCLANDIYVPNTFSPNGDGRNDVFYPMGGGVSGIRHFRIFNRWGEVVFEKNNFTSNDPTAGWDGTYKGKLLTPDVYVYMLVILCDNNQVLEKKGNVTLLR